MSEKNEMQEGRDGSPSRPLAIALPEQKAFFSAKGGSACGRKIPACHAETSQRRWARFGHVPVVNTVETGIKK